MAAAEILNACLEHGSEANWAAFVERFQPLISCTVARVARRYNAFQPALVDDLVQETYLRLFKHNCQALRTFEARHDEAIFGYLKVVAATVALDYFRGRATQKRRDEIEDDGTNAESSVSSYGIEQATLLGELDDRLAQTETERDRTIFWLYYRQGYTARDIAAITAFGLTQKGVESCLYRLTQLLRTVVSTTPESRKGSATAFTLGEMGCNHRKST